MILRSVRCFRKLQQFSDSKRYQFEVQFNKYYHNVIVTGASGDFRVRRSSVVPCETRHRTNTTLPSSVATTTITQRANKDSERIHPVKLSFESIWTKLNSCYKSNGVIYNEQLQPLLDFMADKRWPKESDAEFLEVKQQLFLLEIVGCDMPSVHPERRMKNFQFIWNYFHEIGGKEGKFSLTPEHYHVMLNVLRRNRLPLNDYRGLLSGYEEVSGMGKNETTYQKLLEVAGGCGDVSMATTLLAEMRSLELPLDEHDFNSLLMAYGRNKDKKGLKTVYDSMLATGVPIGLETQTTLALLAIENDERAVIENILLQFQGNFRIDDILRMMESVPSSVKDVNWATNLVEKLVKELPTEYVQQTEVPFGLRRICIEMLQKDQLEVVMRLLNTLPPPIFRENQDIDTYGVFLLHALFRENYSVDKILELATNLVESGKNSRALHVMAEIALRRNPPTSLYVFDALRARGETLRTQYFWPLMMYNFRRHHEYGILRTLKLMKDYQVECDEMTINEYVLAKLPTILSNPRIALRQLNEAGLKTSDILLPIILHLIKQNKWLDILGLLRNHQKFLTTSEHFSLPMDELVVPLCHLAVHVRATKRYAQFADLLSLFMPYRKDSNEDFLGKLLIELIKSQPRRFGVDANDELYSIQRLFVEFRKYPQLRISRKASQIIFKQLQCNELSDMLKERGKDKKTSENDYHFNVQQQLRQLLNNSLQLNNTQETVIASELESTDFEDDQSSSPIKGSQLTFNSSNSTYIKHPRDMSIDELECHLVELEAKDMNSRGVLRRLLQLCVRDDSKLERALEIKRKCDELGVHQSPGMLASIVELYVKKKDLRNAEQHLEKLQKTYPGFLIDEHKFVDYAALLVENDQLEKAQDILQQRSELLNHKIIGGNYLLKNVWNLLSNVAKLAASCSKVSLPKERNLTEEMFEFLKQYRYCKVQNLILGPIIRERLMRKDLQTAIEDFHRLSDKYKHTPLQYELLTLLVRLSNNEAETQAYNLRDSEHAQDLLKVVTEIIARVHGAANMNSGLVMAFAEAGTENQLRRLLLNPEFRLNEELLLKNCEHLSESNRSETLLRLARSIRGLNRGPLNEHKIYQIILENLVKVNDCSGALNLYKHLSLDEELILGQDFMKLLIDLLRGNNLQIPSELALKARVYVSGEAEKREDKCIKS